MKGMKLGTLSAFGAAALLGASFFTNSISAGEDAEKAKPVAPEAIALAEADNGFGVDMFKRLHKDGENTFISPTSIATAMQMATQGAGGETKDELNKVMGIDELDAAAANKALIAELTGRKGVKLNMANSIWADADRITLNDEYVKKVQESFDGAVRVEDFSNPETVKLINDWIAGKTNNLITDMLDEIPPVAVSYLINAIYFKGDWSVKFDKAKTKPADFHLADGTTKKINLMSRSDDIAYTEANGTQIAKLPYGKDKKSAMYVILPDEKTGMDQFVKDFDLAKFNIWKKRCWERDGTIKLPRFKLRFKNELSDELQGAGIDKAFKVGVADFKPMGESRMGPIFISRVIHEAVVIVNEEGTEAAAATIVEMAAGGAAPPKPFKMTCDRPFMFVITDEPTGAILFMGTCYNPADPDGK